MNCKKCNRTDFEIYSSDNHVIQVCKICKTLHSKYDTPGYCCKDKTIKIVKLEMSNGNFMKAKCCINCLTNFGNVKKIENEYMFVSYEERQEIRDKIKTEYYNLLKSVLNNEPHYKQKYYDYLKSDEWKLKRNQRLKIDNYTCQKCGKTNATLQVHHLDYSTIFNENINDLITMCEPCHKKLHSND